MKFVSTQGRSPEVSFREALFAGLAPDGGLYMPDRLEALPIEGMAGASLADIAFEITSALIGEELSDEAIERVVSEALNFEIRLQQLDEQLYALELFHGPTFAFKDVGARVMARLMAELNDSRRPLTVLVATSGDTGSAVAQAFHGVDATRVVVLFPEGAVTPVQEAQFTTLGGNVAAVAVSGSFDDCQRLAKEAFTDRRLAGAVGLTSANSINVGRLIPQTFHYAHTAATLAVDHLVFSVPSGNVGNVTAGLMAWALGAPIEAFVAATTINDTLARYLESGRVEPRASVPTLANAMEVGNPSNLERLRWLFRDDLASMRKMISASVHTDADVRAAIKRVFAYYGGYICDPHSVIGYMGATLPTLPDKATRVFLATAHPAKFRESVEPLIGETIPLPPALADALTRPRLVTRIKPQLSALRDVLAG